MLRCNYYYQNVVRCYVALHTTYIPLIPSSHILRDRHPTSQAATFERKVGIDLTIYYRPYHLLASLVHTLHYYTCIVNTYYIVYTFPRLRFSMLLYYFWELWWWLNQCVCLLCLLYIIFIALFRCSYIYLQNNFCICT